MKLDTHEMEGRHDGSVLNVREENGAMRVHTLTLLVPHLENCVYKMKTMTTELDDTTLCQASEIGYANNIHQTMTNLSSRVT